MWAWLTQLEMLTLLAEMWVPEQAWGRESGVDWPLSLEPQQEISPVEARAQLWWYPPPTWAAQEEPGGGETRAGAWALVLRPQHLNSLAVVRPQEWNVPQATEVQVWPPGMPDTWVLPSPPQQ